MKFGQKWADPGASGGNAPVDEFLDDFVHEQRTAREQGQDLCPGAFDAHLDLDDEACPYCHAIL